MKPNFRHKDLCLGCPECTNEDDMNTEAIDREAIRLANIGRRGPRLILLGTLNPDSQAHYRELATLNLEQS